LRELIYAILLGIVEGVTEFLPISSTGHLLLCQHWMGFDLDSPGSMWKTFAIFIQVGAILAVVVYFRDRIIALLRGHPKPPDPRAAEDPGAAERAVELVHTTEHRWRVFASIALGTIPVLIAGVLLHDWVEQHMEGPYMIAATLLVGGVLMLLVEWRKPRVTTHHMEDMTWRQALGIGIVQVLAVIFPGTSRSAATILGGMVGGLSRSAAAEFSFFLSIPAICAASAYSLLKFFLRNPDVTRRELLLFVIGTLVSFLVAWAVIDWFMHFIRRHTFSPFAIYRIVLAVVVILVTR
jgi:undecaprenyl-diphosphatase